MKTRIVQIGNSQWASVSRARFLEQTGLHGDVEIRVERDALIIRAARSPRAGWAAAFREMARRGDDVLLDASDPSLSSWDEDEWEWQ